MKKKDKEFLRDLQDELRRQSNEANADPVVWGIMERHEQLVPFGYGDEWVAVSPEGTWFSLKELVEKAEDYVSEDSSLEEPWDDVDKKLMTDVVRFLDAYCEEEYEVMDIKHEDRIAQGTGCFLTKRAATEYVRRFGYNHSNPRPWSMCAYRNFELERLLTILKKMNIDDIKTTD